MSPHKSLPFQSPHISHIAIGTYLPKRNDLNLLNYSAHLASMTWILSAIVMCNVLFIAMLNCVYSPESLMTRQYLWWSNLWTLCLLPLFEFIEYLWFNERGNKYWFKLIIYWWFCLFWLKILRPWQHRIKILPNRFMPKCVFKVISSKEKTILNYSYNQTYNPSCIICITKSKIKCG